MKRQRIQPDEWKWLPVVLDKMVAFARFSDEHDIDPTDLAQLVQAVHLAASLGARSCNEPGHQDRYEAAMAQVGRLADVLDFGVDWPGL